MTRRKRIYTNEFKEKAIELSYQRENLKELADELGINVELIYKWRRGQKIKAKGGLDSKSIQDAVDSEEVKQLRKELKGLELEILKKAIHIFSRSDGKNTSL